MRARTLTVRYVGALLAIAVLLVAGQVVVQRDLERRADDARVVNLAGRQRMLGQRLCMLLLALDAEPAAQAEVTRGELARTAEEWAHAQAALREGALAALAPAEAAAWLAAIDPHHARMLAAARSAASDARAAARVARAHEGAFLVGMDRVVGVYEAAARRRVEALRWAELALLALVLTVLALEGALVFRPAVRGVQAELAARAAAARAARLESEVLRISGRERAELAQELHDGVSQQLVGTAFLLRALQRELAASPARARLDDLEAQLGGAIELVRVATRGRHARAVEARGLSAALLELARYAERVFGVACRVIGPPPASELPPRERVHLHDIAREAVINAAKHARASSIEIAVEIERHEEAAGFTLTVRDDGVGISERSGEGLGLHLMAYRARVLGAALSVAPGPARGTTVTCRRTAGAAPEVSA